MQSRDHNIDWENDPLIFLQIFRGHPECGHWALAVVDRTVWKPGIVVLFDSLPDYCPDKFDTPRKSFRKPTDKKGVQVD
jgi:hypothetical protein